MSKKGPKQRERIAKQIDVAFKQSDSVGMVAAEKDAMLMEAFQDPDGNLAVLRDTSDPRCVVVGRTGAGKTALLRQLLKTAEHCSEVDPLSVTIDYLQHETALPSLIEAGVNFDPFFRFLWRHVLTLEVLRSWQVAEKDGTTINALKTRVQRMMSVNAKWKRLDDALNYLEEWGGGQFASVEERSKAIIKKFDHNLVVEGGLSLLEGAKGSVKLQRAGEKHPAVSPEQKSRIQRIVSSLSSDKIQTLREFLQERVLTDPHKPYYVVVDQLDTAWVDSTYSYDLIDALIHVAGEFAEMPNVKIVVALRQDIVEALRRQERRRQWEKYSDLFLPIVWTDAQLEHLLDVRLGVLLKARYKASEISLSSLLPPTAKRAIMPVDYMLSRTLRRPRDLIQFVNFCIREAVARNKHSIGWDQIEAGEGLYSQDRLTALADEWQTVHPGLRDLCEAFRGMQGSFTIQQLDANRLDSVLQAGERATAEYQSGPEPVPMAVFRLIEGNYAAMWQLIVSVLYDVGFLGIKPHPSDASSFAFDANSAISRPFPDGARFMIHPTFVRAVGAVPVATTA